MSHHQTRTWAEGLRWFGTGAHVCWSFIYHAADQLQCSHNESSHWVVSLAWPWPPSHPHHCPDWAPKHVTPIGQRHLNMNESKREKGQLLWFFISWLQEIKGAHRGRHIPLHGLCEDLLGWKHNNFAPWAYACFDSPYFRGACGLAAGISAFTGTSFCVSPVQEEKLDACCATSFCHPPPLWLPLPAAECYLSLPAAGADETQPRTPAVWRSCPSNVCCRAGTQTCHSCWHLLLFQSWASPLNIQSSFASVQTPHLKCHAPRSWRPLSLSFSGGHLLQRRPFWGVFFPPCPGKSCLPRCFQLLRSMRWRCSAPAPVTSQIWNQRQGSYWKESSDALTEDSVSLQWLLSARRKQPHKLSV